MAYILAVLATNRRGGFTASMLKAACEGAEENEGVQTEIACLSRYDFKPCLSSFWCARNNGVGCVLPDDMGKKGEGVLFEKVVAAHGLLLATPVHTWGPSALAHMFWERLYPFIYSDGFNGLPFGAIACATNQGFQRQAIEEISKWAFCRGNLLGHHAFCRRRHSDRVLMHPPTLRIWFRIPVKIARQSLSG